MNVLFEPHQDDAVLFAAYTLLRLRPDVVTVIGKAVRQKGISRDVRDDENEDALRTLGVVALRSWSNPDDDPDPEAIAADMLRFKAVHNPEEVWVPLYEEGGHEHHNLVTEVASSIFHCQYYATYKRGEGRTETTHEIKPEPGWRALKLRAMSCYATQIDLEATRPWFLWDWDREWVS